MKKINSFQILSFGIIPGAISGFFLAGVSDAPKLISIFTSLLPELKRGSFFLTSILWIYISLTIRISSTIFFQTGVKKAEVSKWVRLIKKYILASPVSKQKDTIINEKTRERLKTLGYL